MRAIKTCKAVEFLDSQPNPTIKVLLTLSPGRRVQYTLPDGVNVYFRAFISHLSLKSFLTI